MIEIFSRKDYRDHTQGKIFGKENCFFCRSSEVSKPIIETTKKWNIIVNQYPYSGNTHHIIAFPKRHIVFYYELQKAELIELREIYIWMKDFYTRAGEKNYFSTACETMGERNVEHFHIHFIPGRLQGESLTDMLKTQGYPVK